MNKRRGFLLPFLVVPFLLFGCGTDSTGPVAPSGGLPASGPFSALAGDQDAKWVGAEGGTLSVTGKVLVIPAGALSESTWITMANQADGSVDLGPDGQSFAVAVNLYFILPVGGGPDDYVVQWYDPHTGSWTTIPSSPTPSGRVSPLAHFSLYQIYSLK